MAPDIIPFRRPKDTGRTYLPGVYYPQLQNDPSGDAPGSFIRVIRCGRTLLHEVIGYYQNVRFWQRRLAIGRERFAYSKVIFVLML